jgi:hypothetical protein
MHSRWSPLTLLGTCVGPGGRKKVGVAPERVMSVVMEAKGGFSGGTVASGWRVWACMTALSVGS